MIKNIYLAFIILPKKFKILSICIFFLSFIGSCLELIGIGMFIPLMTELTNSNLEVIEKLKFFLRSFDKLSGYLNNDNWVYFFAISLILIFFIKNFFLSFIIFFQSKFNQELTVHFSTKLFGGYLKSNLLFHKKNNSSKFIRNISLETVTYTAFLNTIYKLISEIFLFIGILIFLLYINIKITIIFLLFFSILALIYQYLTKNVLIKFGNIRHKYAAIIIRNLQQSFSSIKSIKLANLEQKLVNLYRLNSKKITQAHKINQIASQLPRQYFEFFIVFGLCFIVFINKNFIQETSYLIMLLAIYSINIAKAVPSLMRIISHLQYADFASGSVSSISRELNFLAKQEKRAELKIKLPKVIFEKNIEFKNIYFSYQNSRKKSLKNVSFKILKNEHIALIGKSGSGKSTIIDLSTGLLQQQSGTILIDNKNLKNMDINSWHKKIGYVPQTIPILDDTIANNIIFFSQRDDKKIYSVLKLARLNSLIKTLPKKIDTILGENGDRLSVGQKQRIGIARALYNNPEILILDEPTSSLDDENENNIIKEITSLKNKTIILVTHKKNILKYFSKVISIKNGTLEKIKLTN
jgi:ABC-type multidrug transport system fused ATPase/permease subunit